MNSQRMGKPLEAIPTAIVDSPAVLDRIHQAIKEVILPSWITRPPPEIGLKRMGTPKADNWRILYEIHLPLAILSLWQPNSPTAAPDASQMASVLETTLYLSSASIIMAKRSLSPARRHAFREY